MFNITLVDTLIIASKKLSISNNISQGEYIYISLMGISNLSSKDIPIILRINYFVVVEVPIFSLIYESIRTIYCNL